MLTGCESPSTGGASSENGGNDAVVATVDGMTITAAEVEEEAGNRLRQVEHQRYDVMRRTLERVVEDKLVQREAEERGITVEALYQAEVQDKIVPPTESQIRGFFEINKARAEAMGKTFEDVRGEIEQGMLGQETVRRTHEFVESLVDAAEVDVNLVAPRFDVVINDNDLSIGPADAPITILEFADFECGYCKQSHPTLERLMLEYGDQIRFVYRDFPLQGHRRATPSSEAARCAGEQGLFWEYHEELMIGFGDLSDQDLVARAEKLGMDVAAFRECYASRRHAPAVRAAADTGRSLGITGTPAFFVNGRFISGALTYEDWKELLDEELEAVAAEG
jgi:protein-disulfide isomerase